MFSRDLPPGDTSYDSRAGGGGGGGRENYAHVPAVSDRPYYSDAYGRAASPAPRVHDLRPDAYGRGGDPLARNDPSPRSPRADPAGGGNGQAPMYHVNDYSNLPTDFDQSRESDAYPHNGGGGGRHDDSYPGYADSQRPNDSFHSGAPSGGGGHYSPNNYEYYLRNDSFRRSPSPSGKNKNSYKKRVLF